MANTEVNKHFIEKSTIFLAAILQGLFLTYFVHPTSRSAMIAVVVTLAIGFLATKLWEQHRRHRYVTVLLVSGTVGGFGMALGRWLDSQLIPAHHAHFTTNQSFLGHILSFEILLMLIFCIPACEFFCIRHVVAPSTGKRILRSFECHGSMLAGMVIGGYLLSPFFSTMIDAEVLVAHFSMVTGMIAGIWIGLKLTASLI